MKFQIIKQIDSGKFIVQAVLTELSEEDKQKALKFWTPKLKIRADTYGIIETTITSLSNFRPYGFSNQHDADNYAEELKNNILELKKKWDLLRDSWSNVENI